MLQWLLENGIEAIAIFISMIALLFTIYVDFRNKRWRQENLKIEQERANEEKIPIVIVKPNFDLSPGRNILFLEVTNLHSSISIKDFKASCKSTIHFDSKKEQQHSKLELDVVLPQYTSKIEFSDFYTDFDSFVANMGLKHFNKALSQVNQSGGIAKIKEMGFLKNGQPSIGKIIFSWSYIPAIINADEITFEAEYLLTIWQQPHGIFLEFHHEKA